MILKYIKHEIKQLTQIRCSFAQLPKKRTEAPKYTRQKPQHRIDPKNIDYSKIPQDVRKGVKAYVQATNILVTSQAQLQTMALKQVILEERQKFTKTLEQTGMSPAAKKQTQSTENAQTQQEDSFYDLMKAIKFTTSLSNMLMGLNLVGYGLFYGLKKYEYLGFFLGLSINPSIISLTGLAIGFNAATWIIVQSLHLSIRQTNELSIENISLTNCSPLMYLQAISIAGQTAFLGYYLMQPNPFINIWYLIGSYGLSQLHLCYSVLRATGGHKFEYFFKLLITQTTVGLLLASITYGLFSKIEDSQDTEELQVKAGQVTDRHERVLLAKGYKRFLEEFKEKKIAVVKGEAINQIITSDLK